MVEPSHSPADTRQLPDGGGQALRRNRRADPGRLGLLLRPAVDGAAAGAAAVADRLVVPARATDADQPDRLGGRQQRGQRRRHRAAQRQQPAQRRIAGRAVEHVAAVRRCHRRVRPAAERAEPDLPHQRPAPGRHQGLAAQARVLVRRGTGTGLPADPVDDRHHRAAGGVRAAALGTACDRLPDLVAAAFIGGAITSVLFTLGRYGIGVYIATVAPGSAYGSMGALVIALVWIYYATAVFFVGALMTAVIDERQHARAQLARAGAEGQQAGPGIASE
ncbi:hypothetical protein G6F22_008716 [Rhizopus arrhizus]|nr:hypothetical protein G6F22_008716 [Rhizopus arrhizus]